MFVSLGGCLLVLLNFIRCFIVESLGWHRDSSMTKWSSPQWNTLKLFFEAASRAAFVGQCNKSFMSRELELFVVWTQSLLFNGGHCVCGALEISDWPEEADQYHLSMLWPFTCSVCVWQTVTETACLSASTLRPGKIYFPLRNWWVKSAWMTLEVSGILIIFTTSIHPLSLPAFSSLDHVHLSLLYA